MKANRAAKRSHLARLRRQRAPDGGQMLLLAGFLLAATAIIAIGGYTALQRTETQVTEQQHSPLVNIFLNTRERAIDYFGLVTEYDTAASVEREVDSYLSSQFHSAHALSLNLNATLAGAGGGSPWTEHDFTDSGGYATRGSSPSSLWSEDGSELYTCPGSLPTDSTDDGLITDSEGTVLAAIFYINVEGDRASLEEYVVIDVPATSSPC